MSRRTDQLILSIIIGGVGGAWTRPGSRAEDALTLDLATDLARWAQDAKIHALFVADVLSVDVDQLADRPYLHLEPLTLYAALAARTDRIGLIATASSTFSEPFTLARQFASLDHLSKGRAAWNVVTSAIGEANFGGGQLPAHATRYQRAAEFVQVAQQLWDSWEDDAVIVDRARTLYVDSTKVHRIDHVGEHFRVAGPLNLPRSPQGRPVLVQAGSSSDGKELGSRYADVVFTAQQNLFDSQAFYAEIKTRAAAAGRNPDHVKILPGLQPIIGRSEKEAIEIQRELAAHINWDIGRQRLGRQLGGADLSGLELGDRLPENRLPDPSQLRGRQSRAQVFRDLAVKDRLTLRQLIQIEVSSNGHKVVVGSVQQVADLLTDHFHRRGADGFALLPPYLTEGFLAITEQLVPELQNRGVFHADYAGPTLRENLGLPRPPGRGGADSELLAAGTASNSVEYAQ